MAIQKKGHAIGKLGQTVSYLLNGELVTRTIGITDKKPTKPQLTFRQKTKILNPFLKKVTEFINVGFELEAVKENKKPYAIAFGHNLVNAFKGTYPKMSIDFQKVKLSSGSMPLVSGIEVQVVNEGFKFNWNPDSIELGMHWTDQVMLLAYFPKLKKAMYITGGTNRDLGSCLLPLHTISRGHAAETYLSFITNDHRNISNSIYTGQWLW